MNELTISEDSIIVNIIDDTLNVTLINNNDSVPVSAAPYVYSTEYQAVLTRATALNVRQPSTSHKVYDDSIIVAPLVASGDWAKLDRFGWYSSDASKQFHYIDWVDPTKLASEKGSITDTPLFGLTGDGASGLDVNFAPTDGVNYQRDNSSFGVYLNIGYGAANIELLLGAQGQAYIGGINGPMYGGIQDGGSQIAAAANFYPGNLYSMRRTASGSYDFLVNGVVISSPSGASSALDAHNFWLFCDNVNNAVRAPIGAQLQIGGWFAGSGTVDHLAIFNAMRARMIANITLGAHLVNYTQTKITLGSITNLKTYGDSITAGIGASDAAHRWVNLLAAAYGLTLTNNASSGSGVWYSADTIRSTAFTGADLITVMAGLNDLYRNSAAAKTLKKIEACYRSIIVRAIRGTYVASGSASVTRSGSFSTFNPFIYGGVTSSFAIPDPVASSSTVTSGDYWEWTFSGTAFGVQFIASDGVVATYGTCDIYIDSVKVKSITLNSWYDGVTDGTYDNARGPLAYSFHGLSNNSHTIRVVSTSNNLVNIDFFCPINAVANTPAIILCEVPYTTAYVTDAIADAGTDVILSLVDEYESYGFNIALMKTNTYLNKYIGDSYDGVHKSDTGHAEIKTAGVNAIQ